ncbi:indole-3-glycerol phosphate synthase TrpC [Acidaminobacter hydrogenoformans]|uniref:Indole-3-glycerol phosphate synthase n=1 Tax=Acidaminobacter hydrogenoformans DSM 2784 TaxID=1120920 RepID=A0A1G5RRU9_9FIRM|nr:indole-3-glycerol phosphate synthase TrpC [Acidaminobacter hydrogenoformans]SCZ76570.1 indole-3-glycerol phosphate synthase [Acidaminobacter hydrogenoformans DSM 2784]
MILDEIVKKRRVQLAREISEVSRADMKRLALEAVAAVSSGAAVPGRFAKAIAADGLSIIAEVKKASPSKGLIQPDFRPAETAAAYERSGASAISVLTEEAYFQGGSDYLKQVRQAVALPILRKDFIFDDYQIYEAKVIGADAVLLIVAILTDAEIRAFMALAASLGLDALVEVHDEAEMVRAIACGAKLIGINNRDLKTFNVELSTTQRLLPMVPAGTLSISESGIRDARDMETVRTWGADAVLIGETLMRSTDVESTLKALKGVEQ